MSLSRPLFETACKVFIQRRHDWVWVQHPFGYMYRTVPLQKWEDTSESPECADDPATTTPLLDHLVCHQSVVLSPTFQVPAFYFSVHDASGSPLGLAEIMKTSLVRQHALDGMEATTFSIGVPASNFPLLSFGEHPCLGSPCWYLHPCETGPAVEEILTAWGDAHRERWLEAWFLVLSSVVNVGP